MLKSLLASYATVVVKTFVWHIMQQPNKNKCIYENISLKTRIPDLPFKDDDRSVPIGQIQTYIYFYFHVSVY